MSTLQVTAPDISCDNCRRNIEQDLSRQPGVRAVVVDIAARTVAIDYDEGETDPARLREALVDGGYPPEPA
jgi:copper chaperone CopZ